jgi:ABC-type Mn2+/Zn2+ transport system permease subunit
MIKNSLRRISFLSFLIGFVDSITGYHIYNYMLTIFSSTTIFLFFAFLMLFSLLDMFSKPVPQINGTPVPEILAFSRDLYNNPRK